MYERLKIATATHRRSLDREAIVCLGTVFVPTRITPADRIARARRLRAGLSAEFRADETDTLKQQGCP